MNSKFSIAPCSWGIEDQSNPDNPEWVKVLDDAGRSGFSGIELGPYGYLPTDPVTLREELSSRSLQLIAGTIYEDLTGESNYSSLIKKTKDICGLISSASDTNDSQYLVIIDAVKDLRNNTAGNSELAARLKLDEWKIMMDNIRGISETALNEYGVKPVIHPHAGGYIEFRDETEHFLNDITPNIAGLCLDTGHVFYAGEDPAQSLIDFSERLQYVHFKDIKPDVYNKAIKDQIGFFDACKKSVMCSIGKGCVDYNAVFNALNKLEYEGWITVEQERDPKEYIGALNDVKVSHEFLIRTVADMILPGK